MPIDAASPAAAASMRPTVSCTLASSGRPGATYNVGSGVEISVANLAAGFMRFGVEPQS